MIAWLTLFVVGMGGHAINFICWDYGRKWTELFVSSLELNSYAIRLLKEQFVDTKLYSIIKQYIPI